MEKEKRGWSIGRGCERDEEGGSVAPFKRVGKGAHAVGGVRHGADTCTGLEQGLAERVRERRMIAVPTDGPSWAGWTRPDPKRNEISIFDFFSK
jgi:hypothetical protein